MSACLTLGLPASSAPPRSLESVHRLSVPRPTEVPWVLALSAVSYPVTSTPSLPCPASPPPHRGHCTRPLAPGLVQVLVSVCSGVTLQPHGASWAAGSAWTAVSSPPSGRPEVSAHSTVRTAPWRGPSHLVALGVRVGFWPGYPRFSLGQSVALLFLPLAWG